MRRYFPPNDCGNRNNFITFAPEFRKVGAKRIGKVLEWLKRHAWKACKPQKGFAGSNPVLSAKKFLKRVYHKGALAFLFGNFVVLHIYVYFCRETKKLIMKKKLIALCMCILGVASCLAEGKRTVLSAEVYGWRHDMIDFQCVQTPLFHAEFYTNPGEEHHYFFETDELVCMLINGRVPILLMPGDSIHAVVNYEGKNVSDIQFSGTPAAVSQNQLMHDIRKLKTSMRFKQQLLTCLVLDTKPADRIAAARTLMEKATEMASAHTDISTEAKEYIMSTVEADLYNSLMEYPQMYENGRKMPIAEQGIGDYWTLLGDYEPKPTAAMLENPDYISLLMRYYVYDNERKAHIAGTTWQREEKFEDMYAAFAAYFVIEEVRDAVLYNLICNFIRGGQEIERVDPIIKDYKEKYNVNKKYAEILDSLLQ